MKCGQTVSALNLPVPQTSQLPSPKATHKLGRSNPTELSNQTAKLRMAAKPVLASDLIAKDSIGLFEERARKRARVGTRCCASVDDALSGGLVYGQDGIYNISGAEGTRAAETVSDLLSDCFTCIISLLQDE